MLLSTDEFKNRVNAFNQASPARERGGTHWTVSLGHRR